MPVKSRCHRCNRTFQNEDPTPYIPEPKRTRYRPEPNYCQNCGASLSHLCPNCAGEGQEPIPWNEAPRHYCPQCDHPLIITSTRRRTRCQGTGRIRLEHHCR